MWLRGHHVVVLLIMNLIKSFPPVDALIETLQNINYRKHYQNLVMICAFIAAVVTVLHNKWIEHNCSQHVQRFILTVVDGVKTFIAWVRSIFIPELQALYHDCRTLYVTLRTA